MHENAERAQQHQNLEHAVRDSGIAARQQIAANAECSGAAAAATAGSGAGAGSESGIEERCESLAQCYPQTSGYRPNVKDRLQV